LEPSLCLLNYEEKVLAATTPTRSHGTSVSKKAASLSIQS